jgi:predicted alpha/beta superfamily hydrolase
MRRRTYTIWLFALFTIVGQVHAQTTVSSPITWVSHDLKSKILGTDRTYFVAVPAGYAASAARYPVLFLLDANDEPQFVAALANIRFLASRGEVPELIVVGIPNGADRTHDLAPVTTAADEVKQFPTAGGSDAFVTFINDEVLPAVRAAYRTLPGAFLAGHSFGGMLALHAAAVRPGVFKGVISMSPSLQWNDTKYVVAYADLLSKQTSGGRVFVTSGGLEPPIDINTQRFIARMDSTPNPKVALRYQRYPDNTHGMTPLPSLVEGLRFMFEPVSLRGAAAGALALPQTADSTAIMQLVADVERKYAAGARTLDFPETLPENALNEQGYMALQYFKQPGAAVAIFRKNVALYPNSANVYDSLGDGLLALGDKAGARANFTKAVEVAKATGHPVLAESQRKLDALK